MRNQQGFTLIELMIVIAILGILMAIAIPAYQDYTVRTRVSECVYAAAPAKLAVAETRINNTGGAYPANNTAAGYNGFVSSFCTSVTVGANGAITIDVNETGVDIPSGAGTLAITLTPTTLTNNGQITGVDWTCTSTGATGYAPSSCRP
ncbi:MAG: prepilin-type N-terminal cleavage/methylation domain-containing protein [Lysobacteraceae bacterium]|nr:MAG: prepilin-type N-terminal cleavage/methylation domain-containing protein [Xanthomonadaceae bacterium]